MQSLYTIYCLDAKHTIRRMGQPLYHWQRIINQYYERQCTLSFYPIAYITVMTTCCNACCGQCLCFLSGSFVQQHMACPHWPIKVNREAWVSEIPTSPEEPSYQTNLTMFKCCSSFRIVQSCWSTSCFVVNTTPLLSGYMIHCVEQVFIYSLTIYLLLFPCFVVSETGQNIVSFCICNFFFFRLVSQTKSNYNNKIYIDISIF